MLTDFFRSLGFKPEGYVMTADQDPVSGIFTSYFYNLEDLLSPKNASVPTSDAAKELEAWFAGNNKRKNLYFSVCPRSIEEQREFAVSYVSTFWADLDEKDFEDRDACKRAIDQFDLQPSYIVDSGHGYHVYWVLNTPMPVTNEDTKRRLKAISRKIAKTVNGDHTQDLSRILRIPGSFNVKDMSHPLEARLIHNNHVTYDIADIENALIDVPDDDLQLPSVDFDGQTILQERIEELVDKLDPEVKNLVTDVNVKDRSSRDFRVAVHLVYVGATPDEIRAVFEAYPNALGSKHLPRLRQNYGEPNYIKALISKATAKIALAKEASDFIISAVSAATNKKDLGDDVMSKLLELKSIDAHIYQKVLRECANILKTSRATIIGMADKYYVDQVLAAQASESPEVYKQLLSVYLSGAKSSSIVRTGMATTLAIKLMEAHGFFINASENYEESSIETCYYFLLDDHKLFRMGTPYFDSYLYSIGREYLTNGTEPGSSIIRGINNYAIMNGRRVKIRKISYYNQADNVAYIDMFNQKMLRITEDKIETVHNGADEVFFLTRGAQQVEYMDSVYNPTLLNETLQANYDGTPEELGMYARVVKAWLYSFFFKEALPARPLLLFTGPPQAGKSTLARKLLQIVYGVSGQVTKLDRDRSRGSDSFSVTLINYPLVCFDNIDTKISWLNDDLASIATGGKLSKRQLYTDTGLVDINIDAFLMLTSHSPEFRRADIAQRLLIVNLEKINMGTLEEVIWKNLRDNRDVLWSTMVKDIFEIIKLIGERHRSGTSDFATDFRMADWASFMVDSLTVETGSRDTALEASSDIIKLLKNNQIEFTVHQDALIDLMQEWVRADNRGKFSASSLYTHLRNFAVSRQVEFNFNDSIALSKAISQNKDKMIEVGIKVDRYRDMKNRGWEISTTADFVMDVDEDQDFDLDNVIDETKLMDTDDDDTSEVYMEYNAIKYLSAQGVIDQVPADVMFNAALAKKEVSRLGPNKKDGAIFVVPTGSKPWFEVYTYHDITRMRNNQFLPGFDSSLVPDHASKPKTPLEEVKLNE